MSAEESQEMQGTGILQSLIGPWAGSDHKICSDSYCSTVKVARDLKEMGLRLVGVVNLALHRLPVASFDDSNIACS